MSCRSTIKELVEAVPEVTFTASDTPCTFTLGMVIRFHRLGGTPRLSDMEEEEQLTSCSVTMQEDWSKVAAVQVRLHCF